MNITEKPEIVQQQGAEPAAECTLKQAQPASHEDAKPQAEENQVVANRT
jgi:hypothetical protein